MRPQARAVRTIVAWARHSFACGPLKDAARRTKFLFGEIRGFWARSLVCFVPVSAHSDIHAERHAQLPCGSHALPYRLRYIVGCVRTDLEYEFVVDLHD